MFLIWTLVSHVLTQVGQQSPPAPARVWAPPHAPRLQGACGMMDRGCLAYPVSEDTAFPPDVPEL